MKRRNFKGITVITVIILSLLLISVFVNDVSNRSKNNKYGNAVDSFKNTNINQIDLYEMDLKLDDYNNILNATEKVTFFNKSNKSIDDIYFHIYPNAFRMDEAAPVMFNDFSYAYPNGFTPCYIDILNISIDDKKIDYSIGGVDGTILKLNLKNPIKKNEYIKIKISFQLKVPESRDRVGYYNGSYIFGNWYPIAAVYDDRGWSIDRFYDIGDPFYSDCSDYKVKITLPAKYIVASTGDIIKDIVKNGERIVNIEAKSVRDFAWSASCNFKTCNKKADGIELKYYFLNNDTERINKAMETLENSIIIFNQKFGEYPYSSLTLVESYFPTGMEYPGFILIPDSYFKEGKSLLGLEGVIVHETAHQWWYGVVGNNEINEAWIDEGLATYSKVIYFERTRGMTFAKEYYRDNISSVYEKKRKSIKGREIMLKPLYEFDSWREYDTLVYKKAAVLFETLRNKTGDDKFFEILRSYYNDNKFKNANTKILISTVEKVTNMKWDDFFNEWLSGDY